MRGGRRHFLQEKNKPILKSRGYVERSEWVDKTPDKVSELSDAEIEAEIQRLMADDKG